MVTQSLLILQICLWLTVAFSQSSRGTLIGSPGSSKMRSSSKGKSLASRHKSLPKFHFDAEHNAYDINTRCSRAAKRAIPCGKEMDKEERRRSVRLPNNGRRWTARPRSLPVATLPASDHKWSRQI